MQNGDAFWQQRERAHASEERSRRDDAEASIVGGRWIFGEKSNYAPDAGHFQAVQTIVSVRVISTTPSMMK